MYSHWCNRSNLCTVKYPNLIEKQFENSNYIFPPAPHLQFTQWAGFKFIKVTRKFKWKLNFVNQHADMLGTKTRTDWTVLCQSVKFIFFGENWKSEKRAPPCGHQYISPKIGKWKKYENQFFPSKTASSTRFDIFVVTYRVTNFLPKLVDILLFSAQKNWISIFWIPLFSGVAIYIYMCLHCTVVYRVVWLNDTQWRFPINHTCASISSSRFWFYSQPD